MKKIIVLMMVLMIVPTAMSTTQRIFVNQTLKIDVYGGNRTAELWFPSGSTPIKYPLSDACISPYSNEYQLVYWRDIEVQCDKNITVSDIGANLTRILNHTTTLLAYQEKEIEDCNTAIKENVDLHKQLEICSNRTAVLDKYSSLQSAFDVCADDRQECDASLKECNDKLNDALQDKTNFLIYGFLGGLAVMYFTGQKLFKSPAERNFGR